MISFGGPASSMACASSQAVTEVNSLGFATTVLPEASAGAILKLSKYSGKFHGLMRPATPSGSRTT